MAGEWLIYFIVWPFFFYYGQPPRMAKTRKKARKKEEEEDDAYGMLFDVDGPTKRKKRKNIR
jgi:hypothetical protein